MDERLPLERIEEAMVERIVYALQYGDMATVERLVQLMRELSLV